jgi:hypothetical protein
LPLFDMDAQGLGEVKYSRHPRGKTESRRRANEKVRLRSGDAQGFPRSCGARAAIRYILVGKIRVGSGEDDKVAASRRQVKRPLLQS